MENKALIKPKKNRFLLIFICIFVSALIIFGSVFGIIIAVRDARTAAKYGDTYIEESALRYLAPYYKYRYVSLLRANGVYAYDDESFWENEKASGVTYADDLKQSFAEYVSSLLVASAIYDSALSYGKAEKEIVKRRADAVLNYTSAKGDEQAFNDLCKRYGFDYDDMLAAEKYLYKASEARIALYGTDGSGIASSAEDCEKYLATYSHVDLLFIRLEDVLIKDESGNITYDSDGNAIIRALTDEEKAERQATVERLRGLIAGTLESGEIITTDTFEYYMKKSDGDSDMYDVGYYFNQNAEKTVEFAEEFPEVVEAAFDMEIGEYREVECENIGAVCFIYKYNVAEGAYTDTKNVFFSDFYSDAASYIYPSVLTELSREVEIRDIFYTLDIVGEPMLKYDYVLNN